MEEIEKLYGEIAENDKTMDENRRLCGKLKGDLIAMEQRGGLIENEGYNLAQRLITALKTDDITGLCLKSKKEEAMCQLLAFEKEQLAVRTTTVQENNGVFVNYVFPEDLAREWLPVSSKEYRNFRDKILRGLCEIGADKRG